MSIIDNEDLTKSEEQRQIIRAEIDLLNRACALIDCPEFAEFVASRQRYYDVISAAYGVPEAIWNQSKSSGVALETIKEASK